MPIEHEAESAVAEHESADDLESIWGNDYEEWKNWKTAPKHMSDEQFNILQIAEMTGERTKKAYERFYGTMTPPPTDLMLVNFFLNKAGSVFFRRRNNQYLEKADPVKIGEYYRDELWKDEIKKIKPITLTRL
ncbi:MAG: hypothetical protein PHE24_03850 [Patescibacteria group bacterium]|nr:hypothetical protein [Patescibacteria group bacterium]